MKEEYLHQIWLTKRLPMHRLRLTDGRNLTVLRAGIHNHDSGPDFFNGSVEIGGICWNGNIEIHVRSSDWYAHKHHLDRAYDNVILHVVYEHDRPVIVSGEELPVLELKPLIDHHHWNAYQQLVSTHVPIPCERQLASVDPLFMTMQLEDMLISRLQRKAEVLDLRFRMLGNDLRQLQYELLAQSFGTKVNALPFVELTQRMPVRTVWREGREAAPALLLGAAGFLEEGSAQGQWGDDWKFYAVKHRLQPMQKHSWKFRGLRPPGFPDVRILQFAELIVRMQEELSFADRPAEELLVFFDTGLPKAFQHLLLINAVVPWLWWYGHYRNNPGYRLKALELLQRLPPEKNAAIREWESLGMCCVSAADSQALLELRNEMCNRKKCLSCKIGHKILGRS